LGHVARAVHFAFVGNLDFDLNFAVFTAETSDFPAFVFVFFGVDFGVGQGEVDVGLDEVVLLACGWEWRMA